MERFHPRQGSHRKQHHEPNRKPCTGTSAPNRLEQDPDERSHNKALQSAVQHALNNKLRQELQRKSRHDPSPPPSSNCRSRPSSEASRLSSSITFRTSCS